MEFDIGLELPPYDPAFVEKLVELTCLVFLDTRPDYVTWRLHHMPNISTFVAEIDGALVGFKIGYAMTQTKYYSWLGGVHPDQRRRGLAAALMVRQHQWAADQGYAKIETAADQENTPMAKLNLVHGFTACGVRAEPARIQVLYLKDLREHLQ